MANTKYADLGSVSSGTMICEDVFDSCIYALAQLDKARASEIQKEWDGIERECPEHTDEDCANCDEARSEILNETLWNALDEFAPPYAYFGAHPGDGADYGFWLFEDAVDEAIRDGSAIKVADLGEVPADYVGDVFQVSDHGNLTLYVRQADGEFEEIFGIV